MQAVSQGGVAAAGARGADRGGQGPAGSGQHDQFLGPGHPCVEQVALQHHPRAGVKWDDHRGERGITHRASASPAIGGIWGARACRQHETPGHSGRDSGGAFRLEDRIHGFRIGRAGFPAIAGRRVSQIR
jgi:hypothetical protein